MKNRTFTFFAAATVVAVFQSATFAHDGGNPAKLHINPRWSECSFQLDQSLTQDVWRQFSKEAGLVVYFRSLSDARPMGVGNYEFSILQWSTAIDESDATWNDTFVHPDSVHWLIGGDRLAFPGMTFRAGITNKIDIGAYLTKSPGANYGFWGGQIQYTVVNDPVNNWAASARMSFVSIYGPEDIDFTVYGLDFLASKEYSVYSDWVSISPYVGVSAYLTNAHEKSAVVNLQDERVLGVQASIGASAQVSSIKLGVEYNVAAVGTLSLKVGFGF